MLELLLLRTEAEAWKLGDIWALQIEIVHDRSLLQFAHRADKFKWASSAILQPAAWLTFNLRKLAL